MTGLGEERVFTDVFSFSFNMLTFYNTGKVAPMTPKQAGNVTDQILWGQRASVVQLSPLRPLCASRFKQRGPQSALCQTLSQGSSVTYAWATLWPHAPQAVLFFRQAYNTALRHHFSSYRSTKASQCFFPLAGVYGLRNVLKSFSLHLLHLLWPQWLCCSIGLPLFDSRQKSRDMRSCHESTWDSK